MFEGFYIVQFAGMEGKGGGVAVLKGGHLFGGDSGYTYLGHYEIKGERLIGAASIQNFGPAIGNVLGVSGDFTITFSLALTDQALVGDATTPAAPGFGLKLKLTLRAKLA